MEFQSHPAPIVALHHHFISLPASAYDNSLNWVMLLQDMIEKTVGDFVQSVRSLQSETYPNNAQSCQEYMGILKSAEKTVRQAFNLEIALAAKIFNTYSLVHQVPEEVFALILEQSLPQINKPFLRTYLKADTKQYYSRLYQLRGISSAWKASIDSNPYLWTKISSACHRKPLLKALAKSARVPLHIIFTDSTDGEVPEPATAISISDFLAKMSPQTDRWKTAQFHLSRGSRAVAQRYLTGAAPVIETACLSVAAKGGLGMEGAGSVDLFGGQAARLKNLSIDSFPIRWESQILRQVENLEIVGSSLGLKLSQLITILSENSKLKRLSIGATDMEMDVSSMHEFPLSHTRLEACNLLPIPTALTEFLLTHLDIPTCGKTSVSLDSNSKATHIHGLAIRLFHSQLHPTPATGLPTIEVTDPEFDLRSLQLLIKDHSVIGSPANSPTVNFIFSDCKARDIHSWVEGLVRSLGLGLHLRTDVDGCVNVPGDLQYAAVSDCIDCITSNQERRFSHVTFLHRLRRPFFREGQAVGQMAFPGLKSITVFYSGSIDMRLRASLELRYKSTAGPNNAVIERPPDLSLDFRTIFGKPDYQNARAFVGMYGIKEVVADGVVVSE